MNFVIARLLFQQFTTLPEGDLSRLRAGLVNQQALSQIAVSLSLGEHLRLGEGELKSGGLRRPSILADAFEALIGAIYLDGGISAVVKNRSHGTLSSSADRYRSTRLEQQGSENAPSGISARQEIGVTAIFHRIRCWGSARATIPRGMRAGQSFPFAPMVRDLRGAPPNRKRRNAPMNWRSRTTNERRCSSRGKHSHHWTAERREIDLAQPHGRYEDQHYIEPATDNTPSVECVHQTYCHDR